MAAVLPPNPGPLRRRTFRNGAVLLASQTANLINVPATRNAAHDFHAFVASLKPRILQAPGINDENAQEQVNHIQRCAQPVEAISAMMNQLEVEANGHATDFLTLLQEFSEDLSRAREELQDLQRLSLTVRFASQNEITRLLEAKKEETRDRIRVFCLENGLLANYTNIQTQGNLIQFMEAINRRFEDERIGHDTRTKQLVEHKERDLGEIAALSSHSDPKAKEGDDESDDDDSTSASDGLEDLDSDREPPFWTINIPVRPANRPTLLELAKTHLFNPLCAYTHDDGSSPLHPTEYASVLPGAIAQVTFTLLHKLIRRPKPVSHFTATIDEIEILKRPVKFSLSPSKASNEALFKKCGASNSKPGPSSKRTRAA